MDERTKIILAFAIRFLASNWEEEDVKEALDDALNEADHVSIKENDGEFDKIEDAIDPLA